MLDSFGGPAGYDYPHDTVPNIDVDALKNEMKFEMQALMDPFIKQSADDRAEFENS